MRIDQDTRKCKKCGVIHIIEHFPFYDSRKGGRRHECRDCNRIRVETNHKANREYRLARCRERYAKDPTSVWTPERRARANMLARKNGKQMRDIIYSHYGNQCICCKEKETMFLTLDHIQNDGKAMRLIHGSGLSLYNWIIKNHFPKIFQLLCYNCNIGKARNGGICPHISTEGSTTIPEGSTLEAERKSKALERGEDIV